MHTNYEYNRCMPTKDTKKSRITLHINPKVGGILISFIVLALIMSASAILIAFGRGYRFDVKNTEIKTTGLISATSDPVGAQVYVNNALKTATNNPFNIDPGWYQVRISKEGYISWEKNLRVQGEVVTRADAFLFPKTPSLSPVTSNGVVNPSLSPDGTKIAYVIPESNDIDPKKIGLWVYELADRPLGFNRDPKLLELTTPAFDFTKATFSWSPDSTELLVSSGMNKRLYKVNTNTPPQDVTGTYEIVSGDWQKELHAKNMAKLAAFKQPIIDMATGSAKILSFSPDETKLLYEATASATIPQAIIPPLLGTNPTEEIRTITPGNIYVYDSREDRNYLIMEAKEFASMRPTPTPTPRLVKKPTPTPTPSFLTNLEANTSGVPIQWFPTSRHLILTPPGKVDIMEFDRTNWTTVYAGPFVDGFVAPWPSTSRLIVLANFNPGAGTLPNLYTINLR